jgi:ABC-type branched-subunit amino acid transport system ATPase component
MKLIMGVSDRVTVLEYGAKIAEGEAREVSRTHASSRPISVGAAVS